MWLNLLQYKAFCWHTIQKANEQMAGKVAFVTGSARGLGRAFAEALLDKGAKVCISDINSKLGLETERELQQSYQKDRVIFYKCDVTSEQELEGALKHTVQTFGGLDILCNNAGITDEVNWKSMLNINLIAMIHGTLLGFKYMGKAAGRTDGVIINISSSAGVLPVAFCPMYTAAKHGVVGLTRSIGLLSRSMHGVRVNCLCLTFADTELLKLNDNRNGVYGATEKYLKMAYNLMDKVGIMHPREVAECFMRLVEDDKLTGTVLLATPGEKSILQLPMTIPDIFDINSKM